MRRGAHKAENDRRWNSLFDSFLGALKDSDGKQYNALVVYEVKLWAI